MRVWFVGLVLGVGLACGVAGAQSSSSSSSSQDQPGSSSSGSRERQEPSSPRVRAGQAEAGGAAITLETSESLFDLAVGLNACGYDADLANSSPVRGEVRADVDAAVAASAAARQTKQSLCDFMEEHRLNSRARDTAQYVSLALYVGPAPELLPTADETDMPPDALQVVNVLPKLRAFAAAVQLHTIWLKHLKQYEAITDQVHDPVTQMILATNIYLRMPVSSYDGRRLLILVEPMLAPSEPNARIYGSDYVLVTSPNAQGAIKLEQIRHLYLHYEVEPLVYAKQTSMARLTPLLKPVQGAPLDFEYKNDVVLLVAECLIKAIEARTMETGVPMPKKPAAGTRDREVLAQYDAAMSAYQRQAEAARRRQVDLDMRQGWAMTGYFYEQMVAGEHSNESLRERMGQMVYGMDVDRERHREQEIAFLPEGSGDFVRPAAPRLTGMQLAEKKMMTGDLDGALALAEKAEQDPNEDHGEAKYVEARVSLMKGDGEGSVEQFGEVLKSSHRPRTLAWSHIYLGRLYDTHDPAERDEAVKEYKAALAVPGVPTDARAAAETGLKTPFTVPKTVHSEEEPVDPSGKAEKESYKPDAPPR